MGMTAVLVALTLFAGAGLLASFLAVAAAVIAFQSGQIGRRAAVERALGRSSQSAAPAVFSDADLLAAIRYEQAKAGARQDAQELAGGAVLIQPAANEPMRPARRCAVCDAIRNGIRRISRFS